MLTIDKNIDYQQNVGRFAIAIVILDVFRSHIKYIEPLIPVFKKLNIKDRPYRAALKIYGDEDFEPINEKWALSLLAELGSEEFQRNF